MIAAFPHCTEPTAQALGSAHVRRWLNEWGEGSQQAHFPTHLLAGAPFCGSCGATIVRVSGKNNGYYGCLAATKGACNNKTLVRRTLTERVILDAVKDELADPDHVTYASSESRRRSPSCAPTSLTR